MDVDVERSREQAARRKVHGIIEYIKQQGVWHDEHDLIERGVEALLRDYGVLCALDSFEEGVLFQELADLGFEHQAAEMARYAAMFEPQ